VEVASAHLDYRAEAAVEGAAARGLDHVDLPAEEHVAAEHPHVTSRRPDHIAGLSYRSADGFRHNAPRHGYGTPIALPRLMVVDSTVVAVNWAMHIGPVSD
jgi:hypothetical protein